MTKNIEFQKMLKATLFVIILIIMTPETGIGQVFNHPKVKARTANYVYIDKVEITNENTILTLVVNLRANRSIYVSSKTYIVPSDGGDPMYIQKIDDLELDKMYPDVGSKSKKLKFYFPKINTGVRAINFRAGEEGNYWHFFEINLHTDIGRNNSVKSGPKGIANGCRYIDSPGYTAKSGWFIVTKVELCDTATILHFKVKIPRNSWISIPSKSCIRDSKGGDNLFVKSAEGTNIGEKIKSEDAEGDYVSYKLFFPPIDDSVKKIDFREINKGGNWAVYELDMDFDAVDKTSDQIAPD